MPGCDGTATRQGGSQGDATRPLSDALTADDILAKMAAAYQRAESYVDNAQYHQRYVLRDTGLEYDVPAHVVSVAFARPDHIRIQRQVPPSDLPGLVTSVISNGSQVRAFVSGYTGQVLEFPAPQELTADQLIVGAPLRAAILPVPLENLYPQVDLLLSTPDDPPQLLGIGSAERLESAELEGVLCRRVQLTRPDEGTRILWIDAQSYLLRRMEMPADQVRRAMDKGGVLKDLDLWIDFHDVAVDVAVNDATFEMTVPDDAVRVRQLTAPPSPPDPILGRTPQDYRFTDLDGEPVTAESLAGNVVVLDFWFTGCEPCREIAPALEQLYKQYRSVAQFAMLAVSVDPPQLPDALIGKTLRSWGGTMPIVRDLKDHGAEKFDVQGWPTTILLGPDGKVQRIVRGGPHDYHDWPAAIDALMSGEDPVGEMLKQYEESVALFKARVAAAAID